MNEPDYSDLQAWDQLPFLSKVTATAPNLIYIFNQQTHSNEYANRSLGESLGYSVREVQEMGDAMLATILHPEDIKKVGPHFEILRALPDGEVAQLEYRVKHKKGGWVWLLAYETVFQRDDKGDVLRHLGVATDITLQKNAQEAAQAERRAADSVNEELRAFAYSISHDLKSPSNTLQLLLKELKEQHDEVLDEGATQLLDLSLETVQRMQTLVEDVLSYTRVIGQEMRCETVDLGRVVDDVVKDLRAEIIQASAEIRYENLPAVSGSEIQLRILFLNLINNALKFRKEGEAPLISISCTNDLSENTHIVRIKDNGIGIASEHQQRIFDMFKRLHNTNEYPGNGLGLAICKRIALSHGGSISIESAVGEGAEFIVRLNCQ